MEKEQHPLLSFALDILETVVISMAVILVVYIFFIQPHQVDGHSMDPTLQDKEYLLTNKIGYRLGDPKRGDIIVFHAPKAACLSGSCDFIKRVIGLPGETIELKESVFYINGEPLMESYIAPTVLTAAGNYINGRTITLKEDEYFVVGDNRANSSDSRIWGPITKKQIVGHAFFSYWPPQNIGPIKDQIFSMQNSDLIKNASPAAAIN